MFGRDSRAEFAENEQGVLPDRPYLNRPNARFLRQKGRFEELSLMAMQPTRAIGTTFVLSHQS